MMTKKKEKHEASKGNDSVKFLNDLKEPKKLKTLNFGQSTDFMCDVETGICSPVTQKEEGKQ